ncbi:MAG: bifunctional hydroxymethylpyrimidine kinase/phosphomethylpyrimidine kinase [Clostridia bacterium]|nr:bifunctional hydroxymethylpyrimidine kinase/phosphomethylpyrimidine kinase [Clostridia bacterium]
MKTALTIAGSDSCGGAGIQADIKTMTLNGVYAMSAITALTAQNTMGVKDVLESTPEFLKEQIDCIFEDIPPDAVKIGMVSSKELISVIAERLSYYKAKNIVADPVMVATSGSNLLKTDAVTALCEKLFPLATVITPNIPEAEVLSGMKIENESDMEKAADDIWRKYGCSLLLKGGHSINDANDLLFENGSGTWINGERVDNPNTHGTGCTLSSAIAANLAKDFSLFDSVVRAKEYITDALRANLNLGHGSGPLNHAFYIEGKYTEVNK